ncbi:MAG: endo alpha-1,4 polygalactosaminidase, partial [Chloroflexi bacterium]|nr:endo alpha-1,4 polygalactosaminidase [Chloroflexota bacterium]
TAAPAGSSATVTVPGATAAAAPGWFRPAVDATWQWQLTGDVNTAYAADVYDVDLFDTPDPVIQALHDAGRGVICYFSAGSHEDWRADAAAFPADVIGEPLGDWEGERWLDIRSPTVMAVLTSRLDLAGERGCDGVEPDNVDGFANDTGFPLTERDQIAFNRALADAAHARGLAVALKNAPELIPALVDVFDFAVTEQCHEQGWCEDVAPFIAAGKPVFDAEYTGDEAEATALADDVCPDAARLGIATLVLPLDLDDAFRVECPGGR